MSRNRVRPTWRSSRRAAVRCAPRSPRFYPGGRRTVPAAGPRGRPGTARGRGGTARPLARDQTRSVTRPYDGPDGRPRRTPACLPRDPHHRHQRQDQHRPDDRAAAARLRAAHRPLHQPPCAVRDRADQPGRQADQRRALHRDLPRPPAVHRHGGRRAAAPAVVLRGPHRHGLRGLRRRPRRRGGDRGRHGRQLGRHQCAGRSGRRGHPDLARPHRAARRHPRRDRRGEGRDRQEGRHRGPRPAARRRGACAAQAGGRGGGRCGPRGRGVRCPAPRDRRRRASC